MKVAVDGNERLARVGAPVESLLSAEQRRAAGAGSLRVVDAWGNRVGLKGALADGGGYFVISTGERPPSVNACLEAWEAQAKAPALPAELVKFLVRRAITTLNKAGGAASAQGTAALAAATAAREDAAALWAYVAGEGAAVAVFAGGKAHLRDVMPGVRSAVVATRDVLTFRSGATTFDYLDGVDLVEVGTTNKVKLADYAKALPGADAVVACRAADFVIEGFVAAPGAEEIAAAAAAAGTFFVNIFADGALFDERRTVRRLPGDVVVWATPQEARLYDLVFLASPRLDGSAGDAGLRGEAAAALWRFLKSGESE